MDYAAILVAFNLSTTQLALYGALPFLVMGLVAAIRQAKPPDALLPLLSLGLGVALSFLVAGMLPTPPIGVFAAILLGLIAGLMASGVWSQAKTIGKAL